MQILVVFLGALIAGIGVGALASPEALRRMADSLWGQPYSLWLGVVFRLAAGAALILAAESCRYPLAMRVLGWTFVIVALLLPVVGRTRLTRLLQWWTAQSDGAIRAWGVAAVALGAFFVHAAW